MSLVWVTLGALVVAWFTEPWYGIAMIAFGVIANVIDRFVEDRPMPDKDDRKNG